MKENKKISHRILKLTSTIAVPVARGTMEYIAGVDAHESWLPVLGDNQDLETTAAIRKKHHDMVLDAEPTKEYQEKLDDFMKETVALFQGIMSGRKDVMKPYMEGKKYHFVLGMPRTGGTTVYNAVSTAYGWEWEKYLFSMTHNHMPNAIHVQNNPYVEFDMGWRLPWNFNNLMFELCQFLVYVNREAGMKDDIFLKSTPLSYAVKLLNFLFGDRAEYIVTVRHPGAIALTKGIGEEVTREHHMETMGMWSNLYSSILRECRPVGNLFVVEYGPGMTEFINNVFEERKTGNRLEETSFFEYEDFDRDFYESEQVKSLFRYVKNSWALFDMHFPIPEKCI